MRAASLAVIAVLSLWASACTTTSTETRTPAGATSAPPPPARERAAGADESDAKRRARTRLELAYAYFGRSQLDVALEEVKRALAADPNLAGAHNLQGLILASQTDDKAAEESFRRAIQLDPRAADAMNNFGWFLCQRKRYPESFAMFDQALAVPGFRDAARTLLAKGVCQAFDKQYADAERTLSRAQQLEPTDPSISTNLAEVLYRLGQFERARSVIRRVNQQAGVASAQTLWLAARVERRLGNAEAVAELGARLRSQFGDSPEADAFARGRWSE